jgi:hypothetical protein
MGITVTFSQSSFPMIIEEPPPYIATKLYNHNKNKPTKIKSNLKLYNIVPREYYTIIMFIIVLFF